METRAHYVAVGIFVLSAIILAFVAVLWLTHAEFGETARRYYIFFRGSVEGLSKGSKVQYNGIPVGTVVDVRVDPNNLAQVQVTVEIDPSIVEIKTDARAYLDSNLLNGIATIQIRGGTRKAQPLEPKPGHKYAEIPPGQTELEAVKESLPRLAAEIQRATRNINALLDKRNRDAIADTLQNIRTITGNVVGPSRQLAEVVANADQSVLAFTTLLHDLDRGMVGRGGLKDQASRTLDDYSNLAKSLLGDSRQLQSILAENRPGVRDFSQRTLPEIDGLVVGMERLVDHLTQLATELQQDPTRLLFGDRREGYRPP
jgi:phospholipid/cholesterol/gamma-HCH transport system substrate-binding protein